MGPALLLDVGVVILLVRAPDEEPVKYGIDAIGDGRLIFSTDFLHGDPKFPRAVESFLQLPISEQSKRKILWDNCAAYYGLPA